MSQEPTDPITGPEFSKAEFRARALEIRRNLPDKDRRSLDVCERFQSLPQYGGASTVLVFMHVRDEIRTTSLVERLLESDKQVVVPYCAGDVLKLFRLTDLAELSEGVLGIPEPQQTLRSVPEKQAAPDELDLLAVPGLAFDRCGGRVGYGRGYFDRLLTALRSDACSVGLAFECQMFDRVPMDDHDVPLDGIVTEKGTYFRR